MDRDQRPGGTPAYSCEGPRKRGAISKTDPEEVANARIHSTTGAVPPERRVGERRQLQPVPTPYRGRPVRSRQAKPEPAPIIGMQHPLSLYDAFAGGVR